ncbi:MAG: hypothetical protein PHY54_09080 [Methylococcales bacterium]|nr:hypothetical protein [Methylococcales bacterium]
MLFVDGATVLMPDTPENQAVFPRQSIQATGLGSTTARLHALIPLIDKSGSFDKRGSRENWKIRKLQSWAQLDSLLIRPCSPCNSSLNLIIQGYGTRVSIHSMAWRAWEMACCAYPSSSSVMGGRRWFALSGVDL